MNDVPRSSIGWGKPMAWDLNVYGSLGGLDDLALMGDVR